MANIEISVEVAASVDTVWADIARLDTHVEWMADAERIDFLTEHHSGEGTRMEVLTKVGPLKTTDVMEFIAWEPPHRMAIRHEGLVAGTGEIVLSEAGPDRTRVTWREELDFPIAFGGPVGEIVAKPILKAIWQRNLKRLAARFD